MSATPNSHSSFSAAASAIINEATAPFSRTSNSSFLVPHGSTTRSGNAKSRHHRKYSSVVSHDVSRRDSSAVNRRTKRRTRRSGLLSQSRNVNQQNQQLTMDSLTQKGSLTEDDLHELREIFKLVDTDESGDISREELFHLMKQIGLNPTMEQVNEMMGEVDADNNGSIDFHEFVLCMTSKTKERFGLEQILTAFKVFDPEGKGYLTVDKLEHILTHYGDDALSLEEAAKLINTLDTERKGKLHYQKYCTIHST